MNHRWIAVVLAACLAQSVPARSADSLSLDDLGFDKSVTAADPAKQKIYDKRSRMLKTHQILGLITAVPMAASLMTGEQGTAESSSHSRNQHAQLGMLAAGMYFTTAYFSLTAPEVAETKHSGASRIHRALAFVHFPAMIATGVLGYQAKKQLDRGEDVHGAAKLKPMVAGVAAGAYFASLLVMTVNFGGSK